MTSRTQKQLALLGALVVVFVVIVFVVPREQKAGGPMASPSGPAAGPGARQPAPEVADVDLEALKAERAPASEPQRNLFAFRQKPAPPAPVQRSEPSVTEAVPQAPQGPPPPPPIPLKFIGVLESAGTRGKVAILSDGRGNTWSAREGQEVDGRYKVVRIGTESLELSYVDGRGRQTLRLSGQ